MNSVAIEECLREAVNYINNVVSQNVVLLDVENDVVRLKLQDIYYFEFVNRKVKVVSNHDNDVYIRTSLKNILEKIQDDNFGVPHKAFIVNYFYIKRIKGNSIWLLNEETIPVAQKRAANFKKEYFDFLHKVYSFI